MGAILGFFSGYWFARDDYPRPVGTGGEAAEPPTSRRVKSRPAPDVEFQDVLQSAAGGMAIAGRDGSSRGPAPAPNNAERPLRSVGHSAGAIAGNEMETAAPAPVVVAANNVLLTGGNSITREAATIPVVAGQLTTDPRRDRVYASTSKHEVVVIDTTTNTVAHRVPMAHSPGAMCLSDDGSKLFLTNRDRPMQAVVALDLETLRAVDPLRVVARPDVMCNAGPARLALLDRTARSVELIREDGRSVGRLQDARFHTGFLVGRPDGKRLIHGTQGITPGRLTAIEIGEDGKMEIAEQRLDVRGAGTHLAISGRGDWLFYSTSFPGLNDLPLFSSSNLRHTFGRANPGSTLGVGVFSPDDRHFFVEGADRPNTLRVYETPGMNLKQALELGTDAVALAVNRTGEFLLVATAREILVFNVKGDRKTAASAER